MIAIILTWIMFSSAVAEDVNGVYYEPGKAGIGDNMLKQDYYCTDEDYCLSSDVLVEIEPNVYGLKLPYIREKGTSWNEDAVLKKDIFILENADIEYEPHLTLQCYNFTDFKTLKVIGRNEFTMSFNYKGYQINATLAEVCDRMKEGNNG